MRRQESSVKLHPFHKIHRRIKSFAIFNCYHAVFADPLERVRHFVADFSIIVGGYRGHVHNVGSFADIHWLCECLQFFSNRFCRLLHPAVQRHWVCSRRQIAIRFFEHRLGEDRCRCCAVARNLRCLAGRLFD